MIVPILLRIMTLVTLGILFLIILRRYQKYQEKPIQVILLLIGVSVINIIVELIIGTPEVYSLPEFFQFLLIYGVFRLIFAFSFLFYFEFHEHSRPRLLSISIALICIISATFSLGMILNLNSQGVELPGNIFIYLPFIAPFVGLGLIYAIFKIIFLGLKYISTTVNDVQKNQLTLLLIGIVFWFLLPNAFLSFGAFNFETQPSFTAFSFNIGIPGLMLIGIIFVTLGFAISDQVIIPGIRFVDNIIVINSGGVPLYSYKFAELQTEEALLSGGISAITSLLKESIGVESEVRKIEFDEKDVMIKSKSDLGFILITDHTTSYLEYALEQFATHYLANFGESKDGKVIDEQQITEILIASFGLYNGLEK